MRYAIRFAESVVEQLKQLPARDRARILDAIGRQLANEPLIATRNRKRLRPSRLAPWELRVGASRVFYEVPTDDPTVVHVLAVGRKEGSVLRIAGREIKL